MPQFNAYPLVTDFANADIFLVWRTSTGSVKTITGANLIASIKSLMPKNFAVTALNSATTLGASNEFVICNSGSPFTVTLPVNADFAGKPYYISNKGAGTINVAPDGTDTIAGASSLSIPQYSSFLLVSDGLGMWSKF